MNRVLILNEHQVEALLSMRECIEVMTEALSALARGEVHQPLRQAIRPPGAGGLLGLMPSWRGGDRPLFGLKEVCVFPGNPARGLDTHLGAVLLHDGDTGELLAIMNAAAITAIRTAAVSAVATRLLAHPQASTLAIIGAGVQGRTHLEAIPLVREVGSIRVYSRNAVKAATLAGRDSRAVVSDSVQDAVRDADIIVTATSSAEPILRLEWVRAGAHVNAVGSSIATARELEDDLVAAGSLFVDRRESTTHESGDFLHALRAGTITEGHIRAELGEILLGTANGRRGEDEITIFKSLGLAVEDLAAAAFLFERAVSSGTGTHVEL